MVQSDPMIGLIFPAPHLRNEGAHLIFQQPRSRSSPAPETGSPTSVAGSFALVAGGGRKCKARPGHGSMGLEGCWESSKSVQEAVPTG